MKFKKLTTQSFAWIIFLGSFSQGTWAQEQEQAQAQAEKPVVVQAEAEVNSETEAPTEAKNPLFTPKTTPNPTEIDKGYLVQTTLGLGFIVVLLFGLLWVMKRSGFGGAGRAGGFYKVIQISSLGAREKIALLEVGDTWLVVAMTQHSINTLHTLPKGSLDLGGPTVKASETFSRMLEKIKPSK